MTFETLFLCVIISVENWENTSNIVSRNPSKPDPEEGVTLTGALVSLDPNSNKATIVWRVGAVGSDYAVSQDDAKAACDLYASIPDFSPYDVGSRNISVFFDGQEVYRSGLVADKRKGNFLPCSRYATTGREFTVDHSLNVGLNSKAWHSQSTSYPQDVYRTSFRVCGWEESTKFIPAFYSAGVNISRAQGFVVESTFSQIISELPDYGYVLSLTFRRDNFTKFYAGTLLALIWILTILSAIFTALTPLWAYSDRPTLDDRTRKITIEPYQAGTHIVQPQFEGSVEDPPPKRDPSKASEAFYVPGTVGVILFGIRTIFPNAPPIGAYIDFFGLFPCICILAVSIFFGIGTSSRLVDDVRDA